GGELGRRVYCFCHFAIVTSFHTYPYQSEIYEYHYLYSNRRNRLVAMGLWGASPRLHSYKPRDFIEGKRL
ncbi:MAG: hypothetical protein WB706_01520, partial [Nitrososphaeraceae archaeon]